MSLRAIVSLSIKANARPDSDLSQMLDELDYVFKKTFEDGGGADQCTKVWHDTRTAPNGGFDQIDLTAVIDSFGNVLNMASAKLIFVRHKGSSGLLTIVGVGGGSLNDDLLDTVIGGLDDPIAKCGPGGCMMFMQPGATGYDTTGIATLDLRGEGAAIEYDIIVLGD